MRSPVERREGEQSAADRGPPLSALPSAASTTFTSINTLVGYVLSIGVVLSVLLIAAGLVWHWISTGHPSVTYALPQTEPVQVRRG